MLRYFWYSCCFGLGAHGRNYYGVFYRDCQVWSEYYYTDVSVNLSNCRKGSMPSVHTVPGWEAIVPVNPHGN